MNCSSKNRKDVTREQEEWVIYNTLINTSTRRANLDKNVPTVWVDNKRAYDMVLKTWVINSLKIYKRAEVIVYREYHEKIESGINCRRKMVHSGENPERNLPGKCTITITIWINTKINKAIKKKKTKKEKKKLFGHFNEKTSNILHVRDGHG